MASILEFKNATILANWALHILLISFSAQIEKLKWTPCRYSTYIDTCLRQYVTEVEAIYFAVAH